MTVVLNRDQMGFPRVFSEAESVCVCRLVVLVKWEGDEAMEKCRFLFTLKVSIVQCLFKARNGIAPPIGEVASTARHRLENCRISQQH